MSMDEKNLATEMRNPASWQIDAKSTEEILAIINSEDARVPEAVKTAIPEIANVVDIVVDAFNNGGRLFYIGAGTSGRLGVLDASECPPTYGVGFEMVQGVIAGGEPALTRSIENAEDDGEAGIAELKRRGMNSRDVLVGITASGGARFVVEALRYASSIGCRTGAIGCNPHTAVFEVVPAERCIYVPVGAEIVTGSTRMKSGTAQKLVLNMISTTAMIKTGKVYNNLMVNLMPVNEKLIRRSIRIISEILGCDEERSAELFEAGGKDIRTAIVMEVKGVSIDKAHELLKASSGSLRKALA